MALYRDTITSCCSDQLAMEGEGPAPTRIWVPWGTLDFQRPDYMTHSNRGIPLVCKLLFYQNKEIGPAASGRKGE